LDKDFKLGIEYLEDSKSLERKVLVVLSKYSFQYSRHTFEGKANTVRFLLSVCCQNKYLLGKGTH
jgi:hypothetical protein